MTLQGDAVENFWDIPRDRLEKTFMVNIVGMISLAQKAVQHMPSGGSIINVRLTYPCSWPLSPSPTSSHHVSMMHPNECGQTAVGCRRNLLISVRKVAPHF